VILDCLFVILNVSMQHGLVCEYFIVLENGTLTMYDHDNAEA
jgi:hypothetical protein